VPKVLARLQARYKLVVLSNGDPDMLEAARQYHGIAFDRVISAAAANSFKPHVATYTKASRKVGIRFPQARYHVEQWCRFPAPMATRQLLPLLDYYRPFIRWHTLGHL
jgi:hypothetical protein